MPPGPLGGPAATRPALPRAPDPDVPLPAVIERLFSELPRDCCEIDQLAAALMRCCRDQVDLLRRAYDSDAVCALLGEETDALQAWLEDELDEDWLDGDELDAFKAAVRRAARRLETLPVPGEQAVVVAMRIAADALDRSHGRRFAGVFRGRGSTSIAAGDPFPVCRPPLKEIFRDQLGTNPMRLGPQLHELTWLRLMPRLDRGHQVVLDFTAEDALCDLEPNSRIGVLIPGNVLPDLRFERTGVNEPRFFHVRPKRSQAQQETILGLLDQAEKAGARIVVLPELSVDADIVAAVQAWFEHPSRLMSLLVCGSMHAVRDDQHRNVSTIFLRGGRSLEHFKFNPFYIPLPTDDGTLAVHREDIVTHPSVIRIVVCGAWSFTTLICKDFLEADVDRSLEALAVRMVLVPACSPKTDIFEPIAGILAARNQAVVVIANLANTGADDPASVIIARPTRENPVQRILRSEITPPCLLFVDLAGSHRLDS